MERRVSLTTALRGIEGVAHRLAHEDEEAQGPREDDEGRDAQPGSLEVVLALGEEVAEGGRAQGEAEAEEVQGGQGRDGAAEDEGHEGEGRDHGVGQDVAEDDPRVAQAEGPRGEHVLEVARPEELGPDHPDEAHPAEEEGDEEEPPEVGLDHAREDDEDEEGRHARPYLDEALAEDVDLAAVVALDRAGARRRAPRIGGSA